MYINKNAFYNSVMIVVKPSWNSHEKKDAIKLNEFELQQARKSPSFIINDKLYGLGFVKGGLGHSVLSDESSSELTLADIKGFFDNCLTAPATIVGINISQEKLGSLVKGTSLTIAGPNSNHHYVDEKSVFEGGKEWHSTNVYGHEVDSIGLGFGTSFDAAVNPELYAQYLVLQGLLATKAVIPYGSSVGTFGSLVNNNNNNNGNEFYLEDSASSVLNIHKDAAHFSLIAFRCAGSGGDAGAASAAAFIKGAVAKVKETCSESFWSSSSSEAAKLKASTIVGESFEQRSHPLAINLLALAPEWTPADWAKAIHQTNPGSLAKAAQSLFDGPYNYASIGARGSLPHLSSL